jgi:CubicO group peptidase (beta-lactamase class C family)
VKALLACCAILAMLAAPPLRPAPATASDPAAQIDAIARKFASLPTVPSVSIAVVRDGRVIYLKSFGHRELEKPLPADPDTVYDIASLSKQFTAAAFFMLVDEGKLDPHARLSRYLPAIPHGGEITLDQVVGMTSGYQDIGEDPKHGVVVRPGMTRDEELKLYTGLPLLFPPGTQFGYTNTNYEIMALLIEKASGMPFETFVRQRIVEPLHLASWSLLSSSSAPENRATGYFFPTPVRGYIDPEKQVLFGASGSMRLSVRDMAVWDSDLLDHRVVPASVWKAMSTGGSLRNGAPSGYGGGEFVATFRGHRLISHAGNHSDSTTENWVLPDDHLAIAAFCNGGLAPVGALAGAIAGIFIPSGTESPPASAHPPTPPAEVTTAARLWLERALAGKQTTMPAAPASRRRDYLDDFAETGRRYGTIERFTPIAIQDRGTKAASFYSVDLHGGPFTFYYDVTAESGVSLAPIWKP